MSVVANVALNFDARGAAEQLKHIRDGALGSSQAFKTLEDRARDVKAAVEASQGGFANASTVQGVFSANVKNTEQAIKAQIAALKQVQSTVQLGGALYEKAGAQIKQYQAVLDSVNTPAEKTVGLFDRLKQAADSLVGQLAIAASAAGLVRTAFDTLAQQSKAEAALRTLGVNAGVAKEEFAKLSQELNGQASIVELTTAAYDVASAGFVNTADQVNILEAATKGAIGGFSSINTVADATTSILNAYGRSAGDAGLIVDQLIQTQNDGKVTVDQYAEAIGRVIPTAAAAGVSIEEINAAVAALTVKGTISSESVTGLKAAIAGIIGPTDEAQATAARLGIGFNAAALESKGLSGVLGDVAKATGGNVSEINKLFGSTEALNAVLALTAGGSEKFTQFLKNQEAATGAADKAFKTMTDTLERALKQVDTAFKNLIVSFSPVLPAIVAPLKVLASTINLITGNLKQLAVAAAFIGAYVFTLNAAAIATNAVAFATTAFSAAQKVAGVASAFLQSVLLGPAGMANVALALGVATAAAVTLGAAMDEAGGKAEAAKTKQLDVGTQLRKEQTAAALAADETAAKQDIINKKLETQLAPLKAISAEYTKQQFDLQNQIKSLDRGATITSARYEAEKALSDLSLQQLNRQYELATTAEKRLEIARLIFSEQINAAKIEYNQALEAITLGERKIELELKLAELKYKEIQAEGDLQILKAKDPPAAAEKQAQLEKALATQNEVIKATRETGLAEQQVNEYKKITAETQYKSKLLTAQIAFEQKLVSKEIGLSQQQAQNLSTELGSAATNAKNLATSTQNVSSAASSAASQFISLERSAVSAANAINNAANAQARLNSMPTGSGATAPQAGPKTTTNTTSGGYSTVQNKFQNIMQTPGNYGSSSIGAEGATSAFNGSLGADYRQAKDYLGLAKGGVVNGPTLAMVGEGGEREYIIPESKMAAASANYMSGARGGAVIPAFANGGVVGPSRMAQGRNSTATIKPQISIQTGSVVQMGGTNYVTMQDLGRAVQTGVRQTLNIIQGDINMRSQMGLS